MALPNTPVPAFPDVPQAPGVPPVARDTSAVQTPEPTPLRRDDASVSTATGGPPWGLYDDTGGAQLIKPDSFVSVEYGRDWRIADYPLEQGGFESYNKVTRPYELRVALTKGGTEAERADFVNAIDALGQSLTLISTVTPEHTYLKGNISRVSYDRSARSGAALIVANLDIMEIRTTVTATYGTAKTPSAADAVNDGTVQTQPPTAAQSAKIKAP